MKEATSFELRAASKQVLEVSRIVAQDSKLDGVRE